MTYGNALIFAEKLCEGRDNAFAPTKKRRAVGLSLLMALLPDDIIISVGGDVVLLVAAIVALENYLHNAEEVRHGVPHRGALLVCSYAAADNVAAQSE